MKDRTWLVLAGVAISEAAAFELSTSLGLGFTLAVLVAAAQELLRDRRRGE